MTSSRWNEQAVEGLGEIRRYIERDSLVVGTAQPRVGKNLTQLISGQAPRGGALQMTSKEAPTTEFPRSIGKVAARELALSGYTRFEHLTQVSKESLLAIHGVGPKSLKILEEELKKRGLGYKSS